ncbi:MAG: hypothetical protein LBG80_20470 [Bacteroidales bacterium]|jgi:hypothetical protein|nr:hypothetical protein [Bacteroidales bacterium]
MNGNFSSGLRDEYKNNLFETIVEKLLDCSKLMKNDFILAGLKIANNEIVIRNRLVEKYLDDDIVRAKLGIDILCLRFIPEKSEGYDDNTDSYIGRTDISVVTKNWLENDRKDYYTIECKRIDGYKDLNKRYINEGVVRFLNVGGSVKYASYHKKNIIYGFVVKNINISNNIAQIELIQRENLKNILKSNMALLDSNNNEYSLYCCKYKVNDDILELRHAFYNFSEIVGEQRKTEK